MNRHFDEIVSTSTYIKENVAEFSHGDYVSASYQTAGRGQRGNSWESERGRNALFSVFLLPRAIPPVKGFVLNHIVALAVIDVLNNVLHGNKVMIKWPNDIYVDDRKLGGILIESSMSSTCIDSAIVGIGLNVNQERFVSDAPNPVSLRQLTGNSYDVAELVDKIALRIVERYDAYGCGQNFYKEYMSHLYRRGEWYEYVDSDGIRFSARIVDVRDDGLLVVQTKEDSRLRCFEFKTIKYII